MQTMPTQSLVLLLLATAAHADEGDVPLAVPVLTPAPDATDAVPGPEAKLVLLDFAPALVGDSSEVKLRIRPGAEAVPVCPARTAEQQAWDTGETGFDIGPHYVTVQCITEGMSYERVAFVDLDGGVVDLSPVQTARAGHFPHTQCIWGRPVGQRLVLWDYDRHGEPYSCADDSNADGGFTIPRHYLFDPATGKVETVIHDPPCASLLALGDVQRCVPVATSSETD